MMFVSLTGLDLTNFFNWLIYVGNFYLYNYNPKPNIMENFY